MALVCKGICKTYGSVVALEDADLSVQSGEVRAILGGNGSGKSTIAKILAGSVKPDRGSVALFDKPYKINSPVDAKKKRVIITSQELSLMTNLTVAENLNLCFIPTKFGFVDRKAMWARATTLLAELELSYLIDEPIDKLAPSEQYMVEFAKALLQEPDVLIIDEITSALYSTDVAKVAKIVREFKKKGCIILFISHRMSEIFSICDSVTVMRNGRTLDTYPIDEVDETTLLSQMTGKDILVENIVEEKVEHADGGETLLKVENLKLPGFQNTVDLEIKSGDVIGITGLEGHGQSALVRSLFGLMGHCPMELRGEAITIKNTRDAVMRRFAFISGDRTREGVFGERSISENVEVVMNQVLKYKVKDLVGILKNFGVKYGSAKHRILSLSGGNQQKVVIGRWVASNPIILLADDPTKGVDVQARHDIHEIFINLADRGSAVLMVSSDEEELISMSQMTSNSKVLVMYEGQIVKVLTGDDINKDNIAVASMQISGGKAK